MLDLLGRADIGSTILHVAVQARDPVRAASLAALVAAAGHEVTPEHQADLLLADGPVTHNLPLLVLSDEAEDQAASVLPPDVSALRLDAALRAVAVGLIVRAPAAADGFGPARALLTPRELEILGCLGDGLSNKAVARRLGISQHTVKFHLEAVFAKLGVASRAEAVAKGLRSGLIEM